VEFVDGKTENFDAIIMATGYKSNVPTWLKVLPSTLANFFLCGDYFSSVKRNE